MKPAGMKDLVRISDATFLAAQTRLAEVRAREIALREQLDRLVQDRRRQAESDRSSGDAALSAGADAMWLQWIAARQTILNGELSSLLVLKSQRTDEVRKAFGKQQAMRALMTRARMEFTQLRDRRTWL